MVRKIVVGLLLLTVIGGVAAALISQPTAEAPATVTLSPAVLPSAAVTQAALSSALAASQAAPQTASQGSRQNAASGTVEPINASAGSVGDVWSGSGTILELSATGMTLALTDGSEIFVELGPSDYWQAQGIILLAGASVAVDGFFNGTDYHARAVTTSDGSVLAVRDADGSPLWAGGNNGGSGSNGGQGEVQIPADQWETLEGTVTALTNNGIILQTISGAPLAVSFGRADFWQGQSVTFAAGDAVTLLGFWQGDQFSPGQVTKTATGERIMLRDPNGRPLWAGPGRGQGNGSGGQHATPSPTAAGQ